jgi:hypothetical protein
MSITTTSIAPSQTTEGIPSNPTIYKPDPEWQAKLFDCCLEPKIACLAFTCPGALLGLNIYYLLLLMLLLPSFVTAGPVLSPCNSNSTDPCCGIATTFPDSSTCPLMFIYFSECDALHYLGQACGSCDIQGSVDHFGGLYAQYNCWGGYISGANANGDPMYLDVNTFIGQVAISECSLNFPVNGGWTAFSAYSSCSAVSCEAFGNLTRSRSCTYPSPRNNGSDCMGEPDASVLCYHSCTNTTITQIIHDSAINVASRCILTYAAYLLVILITAWLIFVE